MSRRSKALAPRESEELDAPMLSRRSRLSYLPSAERESVCERVSVRMSENGEGEGEGECKSVWVRERL